MLIFYTCTGLIGWVIFALILFCAYFLRNKNARTELMKMEENFDILKSDKNKPLKAWLSNMPKCFNLFLNSHFSYRNHIDGSRTVKPSIAMSKALLFVRFLRFLIFTGQSTCDTGYWAFSRPSNQHFPPKTSLPDTPLFTKPKTRFYLRQFQYASGPGNVNHTLNQTKTPNSLALSSFSVHNTVASENNPINPSPLRRQK